MTGVSVGQVFVRVFVSVFVGVFVWVGFCITGFNLRRIVQHWIDLLNLIKHRSASQIYCRSIPSQTCVCARVSDGWCEVLLWYAWCVVYEVRGYCVVWCVMNGCGVVWRDDRKQTASICKREPAGDRNNTKQRAQRRRMRLGEQRTT